MRECKHGKLDCFECLREDVLAEEEAIRLQGRANMPAGPAMNEAVARAIGWEHWQTINGKNGYPVATGTMHDEWQPSTNIAHAWEAAEKLHIGVLPIGDGLWRAGFSDPKSFVNWWEAAEYGPCATIAEADTAPLAICRAALKAVGK